MTNETVELTSEVASRFDVAALPSLVARIKALFIDILVMLLIFSATSFFISLFGSVPSIVRAFVFIFMIYLYEPVLTAFTGSTLGHKVMRLKVRKYNNPENKISIAQALFRHVIKGLLGWLSFLTVTGNEHKRAIHDLASGSIVLREP
jgi:uncharacterized RDD family membrane protein YckC